MPTINTLGGVSVSVDLETRDFEGYRDDVLGDGGLADAYTPNWSDRSELDLGVALTEAFAFFAGNLSYYQDRCANEALFPFATQRRSVINHCKLIGYELSAAVSASVELTFVTNAAGTAPAGTQIEVDTSDGSQSATFELSNDFVSTGAGTYTGEIALHGTSTQEVLGSSDGSPGQQYELSSSPLALNPTGSSSLEVSVTAGVLTTVWTEVDNFLESGAADEHYRIEIDEDDIVTVIFGDGVNGEIPASGTNNISAEYRVGGGTDGNEIGPNRLTKLVGSFAFITSVTNPEVPSGGSPKETIAEAKVQAPQSLKALNRAVTHEDYATLSKDVPGVSKAYAYRGDGAYEERVVISASGTNPTPTGTWDPFTETGTGLIGAAGAYLNARKTTPVILKILPVNVVEIDMVLVAYLFKGVRQSSAIRNIEDSLVGSPTVVGALEVDQQELGQQMPLSKPSDVVEDVGGVDYVDVIQFQRVPWARQLNTGSLFDGTFGGFLQNAAIPRDRWTISFTSATNFTVSGYAAGDQSTAGTLGVPYTTDDGYFTFTVSPGTQPPTSADRFEIVVGPYTGNIDPDSDEICKLRNNEFQLTVFGGVG